jgi:hypothetical protein
MKIVPVFLFLFIPLIGWGQSFVSVVDLKHELYYLGDTAVAAPAAADGRIVIIEGLMADTEIDLSGDEARVFVTLIGGSWIGTSEVRAYTCRVLFPGDKWLDIFPASRPEAPSPEYVPPGSRLLLAVRITGYDKVSGVPEALVADYRLLQ